MTRRFFTANNADDLKKEYKQLAKKLHPDNGGSVSQFQDMRNEFEYLYESMKDIHVNAQGETYTATHENKQTAKEYMDIIDELLKHKDLEIEICGRWIWITGHTWNYTNMLKQMHFRYSANKKAWYFHQEPYRKKSKKKMTLDDIRKMYGSIKVSDDAETA